MENYTDIFKTYNTSEGIPFYLLNKRIEFPDDRGLFIYNSILMDTDIPWTLLSYRLYGDIKYWWLLCSLNKSSIFYAKEGSTIFYIKPEYLTLILSKITNV